ncbi:MAG TPA: hypothetical protein VH044_09600 [Polyangiaceae bacterium]|jgi:hypothetical protein|nr:hypothetical protein [Polyangiaceae bacterium]
MPHDYPTRLAEFARTRWRELRTMSDPGPCDPHRGELPGQGQLEHLLSVAYQASLLLEEDRPVRFRLFVGDPARFPPEVGPPQGLHCLRFIEPRRFDEQEIRRLAPAAKFTRALIGVRPAGEGQFEIWGMLQSGPRWLQSARGGRPLPSPVPADAVVVRAVAPGRVAVALGEVTLAELRQGRVQNTTMDTFESKWLSARFLPLRAEILAEHERAMEGQGVRLEPDVTRKIAQQMVKRLIATMRDAHHGGTLLLVPRDRAASLVSDGGAIRLKYAFVDEEPRRRYQTLILSVMRALALLGAEMTPRPEVMGWAAYRASTHPTIAALDEGILEMSQLLAALGEVDGAVLITDRFETLGFGGEIAGRLPEIRSVRRALDLEGETSETVAIEHVGTRHRSAYRLCAQEPGAVAIVVSHDGGVQFVASRNAERGPEREQGPMYWEHVPVTGAEI